MKLSIDNFIQSLKMSTIIRFVDRDGHILSNKQALNKMRSIRSVTIKFYYKTDSHSIIIEYYAKSKKIIINSKVLEILPKHKFNDQQLEIYNDCINDRYDDYIARIKGTLAFFRFGNWIDGNIVFTELMDTFIISIIKNASLEGSMFKVDCTTNILTNVVNGRKCDLPTEYELANTDFFKIINNL